MKEKETRNSRQEEELKLKRSNRRWRTKGGRTEEEVRSRMERGRGRYKSGRDRDGREGSKGWNGDRKQKGKET